MELKGRTRDYGKLAPKNQLEIDHMTAFIDGDTDVPPERFVMNETIGNSLHRLSHQLRGPTDSRTEAILNKAAVDILHGREPVINRETVKTAQKQHRVDSNRTSDLSSDQILTKATLDILRQQRLENLTKHGIVVKQSNS